jgi:hypothetical protein
MIRSTPRNGGGVLDATGATAISVEGSAEIFPNDVPREVTWGAPPDRSSSLSGEICPALSGARVPTFGLYKLVADDVEDEVVDDVEDNAGDNVVEEGSAGFDVWRAMRSAGLRGVRLERCGLRFIAILGLNKMGRRVETAYRFGRFANRLFVCM